MQTEKVVPYLAMKVQGKTLEMVVGLPSWAVFRLGKEVRLTEYYSEYPDEPTEVYQPGSVGLLDGIQHRQSGPTAMVDFGTNAGVVEVPFSLLEPVSLEEQGEWHWVS